LASILGTHYYVFCDTARFCCHVRMNSDSISICTLLSTFPFSRIYMDCVHFSSQFPGTSYLWT
jgi:hypothetical protein